MTTELLPSPATPPPAAPRGRAHTVRAVVAGAMVGALAAGSAAFAVQALTSPEATTTSSSTAAPGRVFGSAPGDPYGRFFSGDDTALPGGTAGQGTQGAAGTQEAAGEASAEQEVGVVDVTTTLSDGSQAAGTGVVLTSDGEVLTNHHVIAGSTSITATVVSTGRSYTATLVGADTGDDVAVLRLQDASGLDTVDLDTSGALAVGDEVTGVGNAGGDGGSSSAAPGTVTALDEQITTQSEGASAGETLSGLIEIEAAIASGDSGGPLYDADGEVVGIDTAASVGGATTLGYAIPISTALAVADQIVAGDESGGATLGYPAFLGVELSEQDTATGATLAGVVEDSGAAAAGLAAGDVVTAIDGTSVDGAQSLASAIATHEPGDRVVVDYLDQDGAQQQATVVLGEGPAA